MKWDHHIRENVQYSCNLSSNGQLVHAISNNPIGQFVPHGFRFKFWPATLSAYTLHCKFRLNPWYSVSTSNMTSYALRISLYNYRSSLASCTNFKSRVSWIESILTKRQYTLKMEVRNTALTWPISFVIFFMQFAWKILKCQCSDERLT